jgi:MarR family transcriptional regulator, 2-MHQ and catechol-resistance regulon repressor
MSQITNKTLTILLKASKHVEAYLGKDMASYGINPTEFVTLEILLNKGPQTIQSISERILMANSSLTYVIDNLVDKKLISKRINSKDKRAFVIDLTASGKDLISKLFVRHEQTIEELFNVLSKDEISAIATNLKKLGLRAQALKEE